jgi:hypothetical protein
LKGFVLVENSLGVLVLAYRSPELLGQLLRSISEGDQKVFVHIDVRADQEKFRKKASSRAVFASRRFSCGWGTWGRVAATIELIRHGLQEPVTHLALISEDSFLLFHPAEIEKRLPRSELTLLMDVEPMGTKSKPMSRISKTSPFRGDPRSQDFGVRFLNKMYLLVSRRDWRSYLGKMTPLAGDSWWILPRRAAQEIVDFVDSRPDVVSFFESTWIPDEHFFQTVLGNSPSAYDFAGSPMYANWTSGRGSFPPYFLRECDEEEILASRANHLFARKLELDDAPFSDFTKKMWKLPAP